MPDGTRYDLTSAAQDPDFMRASMGEKIAYLSAHDKDFASANLKDKLDYLNQVVIPTGQKFQAAHTPGPNETGFGNRIKQFASEAGKTVAGITGAVGSAIESKGIPSADQVSQLATDYAGRKVEGRSPAYAALATGAQAMGIDPSGMEQSAEHGDPTGVVVKAAGQAAPILAGSIGDSKVSPKLAESMADFYSKRGSAIVDSQGNPKPLAKMILGSDRASALGEILRPEIAERAGAQEIRSAKAEMEKDIAKSQLQKASAQSKMQQDIESGRLERLAAYDEMQKDLAKSEQPSGIISPSSAGPSATTVSEGRPATWSMEDLNRLALQGNKDAIRQFVSRGKQLPTNTRYVAGDASYPGGEYNPRSRTVFSPEGTPIEGSIKVETDSNGTRWAVATDKRRVSIPKSVSDADIQQYAGPKLQEQRDILKRLGQ